MYYDLKRAARGSLKAVLIAGFLLLCGITGQDVHASVGGLALSPTSIDVEIAPGASYTSQLTVLNQGEVDTDYKVYATPYSVTGEEYKPYFTPIKGATDITKWFTFSKTNNTLKVNSQDSVPFTISVPKGAGAGSYFATVFAETTEKATTGVVAHKRVGMIVYLRVSGNAMQRGNVDQWNVPIIQQSPLAATVKIANTGSVHFPAKVKVTISDILGNPKYAYERMPEILPQKLRAVPVNWPNGATFGLFKVSGEVNYLGKTEKLSTRLVLIANTPMRLLIIGLLLALVIGITIIGRNRVAARKK